MEPTTSLEEEEDAGKRKRRRCIHPRSHSQVVRRAPGATVLQPAEVPKETLRPSNEGEIQFFINLTQNSKDPGADKIGNQILKKLPGDMITALTNFTNAVIKLRHFPKIWKLAEVIMLFKAKKRSKTAFQQQAHQSTTLRKQSGRKGDTEVTERRTDHPRYPSCREVWFPGATVRSLRTKKKTSY